MGFWIVAGFMSLLVALLILLAFLRPRTGGAPAAAYDLQVYRDQLKEVDRDLERGILTEAEAARARTEVSRRILEADRALQRVQTARTGRGALERWIVAGGLVAVVAGAVGVYFQIGAPGYPDLPMATRISIIDEARATRPGQAEAEAEVTMRQGVPEQPEREELVAQLRTIMEQRPDDPQGMALLASNEAALGNFRAARIAQARLIELSRRRGHGRPSHRSCRDDDPRRQRLRQPRCGGRPSARARAGAAQRHRALLRRPDVRAAGPARPRLPDLARPPGREHARRAVAGADPPADRGSRGAGGRKGSASPTCRSRHRCRPPAPPPRTWRRPRHCRRRTAPR